MSYRTRKALGRQLRSLREQNGLRHLDLELIGSRAKSSRIENGEQSIRKSPKVDDCDDRAWRADRWPRSR
ncbi:hypothetical protein Kisp01_67500 [Kineosporia sp. NBRC 101677]|nr:hypothetical protein Kisp01_67500 [Kineosporia sp. NBRC 101677]